VQERPAPAPVAAPAPAAAPELKRSRQPSANEAEQLDKAERQKSALEAATREQELSASRQAMRGDRREVAGSRDTVEKPEPEAVLSYSRPINATVDNTATIQRTKTDPEAWLKEIRQLRIDNKQEEADREWRRFREAFPDYEVSETDAAREAKK
jgi:hypothetical protein